MLTTGVRVQGNETTSVTVGSVDQKLIVKVKGRYSSSHLTILNIKRASEHI